MAREQHHQHDDEASLALHNSSSLFENIVPRSQYHNYAMDFIILCTLLGILGCNMVVFVAISFCHRGRARKSSPFGTLILSLALADLLLLVPVVSSVYTVWADLSVWMSDLGCRFLCCLDYGLQVVIALHLAAVSVERYKSMDSSFRGDRTVLYKTRYLAAACWILGCASFAVYAAVIPRAGYSYMEISCLAYVPEHGESSGLWVAAVLLNALLLALCLLVMTAYTLMLTRTLWRYEHLRLLSSQEDQPGISPPPSPLRPTEEEGLPVAHGSDRMAARDISINFPGIISGSGGESGGPVTRSKARSAGSPVGGGLPLALSFSSLGAAAAAAAATPPSPPPPSSSPRMSLRSGSRPHSGRGTKTPPSTPRGRRRSSSSRAHPAGSRSPSPRERMQTPPPSPSPSPSRPPPASAPPSPPLPVVRGGVQLTRRSSTPPRTPRSGEERPEQSQRQRQRPKPKPKHGSHKAACVFLCCIMSVAVLCLSLRCWSNVSRHLLGQVFMEAYPCFHRILFYLVGVTNPVLYMMYEWRHFEVDEVCDCWYCNV